MSLCSLVHPTADGQCQVALSCDKAAAIVEIWKRSQRPSNSKVGAESCTLQTSLAGETLSTVSAGAEQGSPGNKERHKLSSPLHPTSSLLCFILIRGSRGLQWGVDTDWQSDSSCRLCSPP
ncbi:hypothetical protein FQN60_007393 [Etheostoma spectabile]|uniref:Uncharacterized protein n=1 Tax=Etheostoma spectabile TaxID=54343 RepID=A0A5J5CXF9_9PERO|nr:hypothetical protein FQN60_007393 [Etheostoma spectabile]